MQVKNIVVFQRGLHEGTFQIMRIMGEGEQEGSTFSMADFNSPGAVERV